MVPGVGYCCVGVLCQGRVIEGLQNFKLEEPLSVKSSVKCSVRTLEDKNIESSAEDGGLACGVSEGSLKALPGSFVILN